MPITFSYDETANILYETATGKLTIEDFMKYRETVKHAGLKKNFRNLADYSQATLSLSPGQFREYVSTYKNITQIYGNIKIAIIALNNHVFGIGRMFELILENENIQTEVFNSLKEAKEWLLSDE